MLLNKDSSSPDASLGAIIVAAVISVTSAGVLGYLLGKQHVNRQNQPRIVEAPENVKIEDKKAIVDIRISHIRPLVPPACLLEDFPLSKESVTTVTRGRQAVTNILNSLDDRLVVVVGPCSIHDVNAAIEYATKLAAIREELKDDLEIIMRVYFEKPRTSIGWKGLINDPDLNSTFNINKGLKLSRELLVSINHMGVPAGCEFLDTLSPQFTADLVSWGAIGARTTECQLHRELASGLSMPVGFKNGTGGSLQLAVDAVVSAKHPHCFLSISTQGLAAIVKTSGNDSCHIILRGGKSGPNYEKEFIEETSVLLKKANVCDKIMVDCSHGNSQKLHTNQVKVAASIAEQIANGDSRLFGIMVESNLVEGNQKLIPGKNLEYGKSITDACIDWKSTTTLLRDMSKAVQSRRKLNSKISK